MKRLINLFVVMGISFSLFGAKEPEKKRRKVLSLKELAGKVVGKYLPVNDKNIKYISQRIGLKELLFPLMAKKELKKRRLWPLITLEEKKYLSRDLNITDNISSVVEKNGVIYLGLRYGEIVIVKNGKVLKQTNGGIYDGFRHLLFFDKKGRLNSVFNGILVQWSGNIYSSESNNKPIKEIDFTDPPTNWERRDFAGKVLPSKKFEDRFYVVYRNLEIDRKQTIRVWQNSGWLDLNLTLPNDIKCMLEAKDGTVFFISDGTIYQWKDNQSLKPILSQQYSEGPLFESEDGMLYCVEENYYPYSPRSIIKILNPKNGKIIKKLPYKANDFKEYKGYIFSPI